MEKGESFSGICVYKGRDLMKGGGWESYKKNSCGIYAGGNTVSGLWYSLCDEFVSPRMCFTRLCFKNEKVSPDLSLPASSHKEHT